jgi:hypothetical protein
MTIEYNIYCDESCHLENDGQKAMVLGAVWCPKDKRLEIAERIREIKQKHGLKRDFEIKWTKVSPSKLAFYQDVVDYFFDDDDLHFRGLVVPDKSVLDHKRHQQDHDEWYYKMYFTMLKTVFDPDSRYYVYIDIKDTLGHERVEKLRDILCTNAYDFSKRMIADVKRVHSHEVEHLQIADLLIGALSYLHRNLSGNSAKEAIVARIRQRSGYRLTLNTMMRELKFNLLIWKSRT